MAKKVEGLTLEFGVETTKFNNQINSLTKPLREIQKVLSEIDKQLKFDPTNINLINQRIKILNQEVEELNRQEKLLTEKLKDANVEFEKSKSTMSSEAIIKYEQNIAKLETQLQKTRLQQKRYTQELVDTERAANDSNFAMEIFGNGVASVGVEGIAAGVAMGNLLTEILKLGGAAVQKALDILKTGLTKIWELTKTVTKTGIEYNKEMGSYSASLNAIFGGTDEAKTQTNNLVKAMQSLASSSSFSASALLEASMQIAASGSSAEETQKAVTNLGKALAFAGKGDDELSRMAQNLNQIKNAGKATAQDLKQFAYAGVPIYTLLADYSNEFKNITKDTVVQYDDLVAALSKAGEEGGKFYDAFNIQTGTLSGQLTALENNAKTLSSFLTEELSSALTNQYLPSLNSLLISMNAGFQENGLNGLSEAFRNEIGQVIEDLGNPDTINSILEAAQILVDGLAATFDPETEEGRENRQKLETACQNIGKAVGQFIFNNIGTFIEIGKTIGGAMADGIWQALYSALGFDILDASGIQLGIFPTAYSGGFGDLYQPSLQSGGFSSGGLATINANFTINNQGQPIAQDLAYQMVAIINEELGGMV